MPGCVFIFFFKQKTAYEMRISDWSSDVCSSDLVDPALPRGSQQSCDQRVAVHQACGSTVANAVPDISEELVRGIDERPRRAHRGQERCGILEADQIGRASCRERVCQYV